MRYDIGERTRTHGDFGTRLYRIWAAMKRRCNNKNCPEYPRYGGAGISYDPNWETYEGFRDWARSHGYSDKLTLDRIDNSKGYFPDNCRWADWETQQNNRTNNLVITKNGVRIKTKEAADILEISLSAFYARMERKKLKTLAL